MKKNHQTVGDVFRQGFTLFYQGKPSAKTVYSQVEQMIEHFGDQEPITTISNATVVGYVLALKASGNTEQTIDKKLGVLRRLLVHAYDMELIPGIPKINKFNTERHKDRFLTRDEARNLLDNIGSDYRLLVTFLLYTGCRIGEALSVTWDDISATHVTFWETKVKRGPKRNRTVPLDFGLSEILQQEKKVAQGGPFARLGYTGAYLAIKKVVHEAGLGDDVSPHTLRHTYASWVAQSGKVSLDVLRDLLGHTKITMTERYAHLIPGNLEVVRSVTDGFGLGSNDNDTTGRNTPAEAGGHCASP